MRTFDLVINMILIQYVVEHNLLLHGGEPLPPWVGLIILCLGYLGLRALLTPSGKPEVAR